MLETLVVNANRKKIKTFAVKRKNEIRFHCLHYSSMHFRPIFIPVFEQRSVLMSINIWRINEKKTQLILVCFVVVVVPIEWFTEPLIHSRMKKWVKNSDFDDNWQWIIMIHQLETLLIDYNYPTGSTVSARNEIPVYLVLDPFTIIIQCDNMRCRIKLKFQISHVVNKDSHKNHWNDAHVPSIKYQVDFIVL